MIIKIDLISDLESKTIDIDTVKIQKDSLIEILKSNDPQRSFNNAIFNDDNTIFDFGLNDDDLRFKAILLSNLVNGELIGPENALNFFQQYKKGNLIIYPETPLFKFVKIIPINLIKSVLKRSFVKANEVTGNLVLKIKNL